MMFCPRGPVTLHVAPTFLATQKTRPGAFLPCASRFKEGKGAAAALAVKACARLTFKLKAKDPGASWRNPTTRLHAALHSAALKAQKHADSSSGEEPGL
eukprot:1150138-Pelagomonas_calceolata.AAC.6